MPFMVHRCEKVEFDNEEKLVPMALCATREIAEEVKTNLEKIWAPYAHKIEELTILTRVETRQAKYPIGYSFEWTMPMEQYNTEAPHMRYGTGYGKYHRPHPRQPIEWDNICENGLPDAEIFYDAEEKMEQGQVKMVRVRSTVVGHTIWSFRDGVFIEMCICETVPA